MERKHLVVVRDMVVVRVTSGVLEDVEDSEETLVGGVPLEMEGLLTLLHVASIGFVTIWQAAVPIRLLSLKVEVLAPLLEVHRDPGNEAQETVVEEVAGRFVCRAMNVVYGADGYEYPIDEYVDRSTFPSRWNRLIPERIRRENQKETKTKKILYWCGICWCHILFS